jgi:hypothetical protein
MDSPLPGFSRLHSSARNGEVRRQPFLDRSIGRRERGRVCAACVAGSQLLLYEHALEQPLDGIEGVVGSWGDLTRAAAGESYAVRCRTYPVRIVEAGKRMALQGI